MIGIYKITSPSNKIYIGQSTNIKKRFASYLYKNCKSQTKLYNSFLKYGVENHKFEIICECLIIDLNNKERFYQDLYNSFNDGLNCRLTFSFDKSGLISNESKLKISNSKKGISFSNEHKYKMKKNAFRKNLVLDFVNGIYYESAKIACKSTNEKYYTFIAKLNGRRKNNTNYINV
jgi:group I intron endonuclease